jgi:alpha-ketoglutarate-dependent taurine dioxygenase
VALGQRIGPIEILAADRKAVAISNQNPEGGLLGPDSGYYQILRGNEGWHTDSSYMPVSARASILAAEVLPDAGGETQWADMRAAYQALSGELRERIDGLAAYHSLYHSQAKIGHQAGAGSSYGLGDQPPPLRPLVKIHSATNIPSLYIGRHAYGIPGLSEADSEALLTQLVEDACQSPRVLTHSWTPGDVVMWDNRCVLHRARPYDYNQPRVMRHVRVTGDPATESSLQF